jgi:2-amino-4-hydroxy-6-hydroxymethyldihydropteridine diphosphokinase
MDMTEVYLALGSNLGDSRDYLKQAVEMLGAHLHQIKQAPIYRSEAVGYTDQPDFLNTVVCGQTDLSPTELLAELQWIEKKIGRTKTFHWGPREIDIDIIFYGNTILKTPKLTIPHDRFRERAFVLQPLADLNPNFIDPESGLDVSLILKAIPAKERNALQRLT